MAAQQMTIGGRRYVVLPEREYRELKKQAGGRTSHVRGRPDGRLEDTVDAFEFINQSVGQTIRACRRKAGMGQLELANAAGVRPETVSRIERGQGNPTVRTVEKLLRAMGLDPAKV